MRNNQAELLTVAEVAELTRLKVPTIYAYAERRQIPHVKLGLRVLFERDALAGWLESKRVEPLGGAALSMPSIIRVEHSKERPYLTISTATIRELHNDLQALGLLVTILARPDDWRVRTDALAKELRSGKTTVLRVLSRLIDRGFVKRADIRRRAPDGSGRIYERRTVYTVFEDKALAAAWTEGAERQRAHEDDGATVLQYGLVPF